MVAGYWDQCKTFVTNVSAIPGYGWSTPLNDTKSDYNMLLSISGFETLHLKRIHMFALEVFKCLYDLSPSFMSSIFNIKQVPYNFRDNQILTLPNFKNMVKDLSNITGHMFGTIYL